MDIFKQLGAEWIWLAQENDVINQYVDFRHEFILDHPEELSETEGLLYVSIDTEYAVWLNGTFIGFNQYDDHPNNKSYDVLSVKEHLVSGKNVLCILGYCQNQNSFQYIKGRPGLVYALSAGAAGIVSGIGVRCRQSLTYDSGEVEKVSPQLSFTFHYDADQDDGWLGNEYALSETWPLACINREMAVNVSVYKRPNKKLVLDEGVAGRISAQGFFCRKELPDGNDTKKATTASKMQSDYLSARLPTVVFGEDGNQNLSLPGKGLRMNAVPEGNDGIYLLIDMQREEAGLFKLELDGEKGTKIDVAYGEQLDDLRVRASVGGRNFAFTYACRDGHQEFTHYFKRIAGRYLQLHISGVKKSITLYNAGIRPARYPLDKRGSFSCNDHLFNKIYDVSVRTLELCMHEHYEDTPWREQALYAMDSRNQALCGYYCFGEYDFAESAFSLFAEKLNKDGMFEICAPAQDRITIPSFSMAWILAIRDLVLFSGRIPTAVRLMPAIKQMLAAYMGTMENGLMKTPSGDRYWNFYEWADGLDDPLIFTNPSARDDSGRIDAPLNLFFCLALQAGMELAGWVGDREASALYGSCLADLRKAFHPIFWDDEKKAYKSYAGVGHEPHFAEITQGLALCSGVVPEDCAGIVRARLANKNNSFVRTTLSYALYKYEALLQDPDRYAAFVFEDIASDWGHMLFHGATSFWETIQGADDFDKAGSLCHGWSAIPVYFFHAYILGIKPLKPGFSKYARNPVRNVVDKSMGSVPTPFGVITSGGGNP